MSAYTCDRCRLDGGLHYDEDPDTLEIVVSRCPNRAQTEQQDKVQELAKLAHENAWKAAQQIMRDVAAEYPEFNANVIRDRFEQAGIPPSLNGSAFTWAKDKGLIERVDGASVWSTKQSTKHDVKVWRSLRYRQGRAS